MHAFWNLILKGAQDKAVAVMSIFFSSLPLALAGLWIGGLPKAIGSAGDFAECNIANWI